MQEYCSGLLFPSPGCYLLHCCKLLLFFLGVMNVEGETQCSASAFQSPLTPQTPRVQGRWLTPFYRQKK